MTQLSKQEHADLAQDSYENRVVTPPNKTIKPYLLVEIIIES